MNYTVQKRLRPFWNEHTMEKLFCFWLLVFHIFQNSWLNLKNLLTNSNALIVNFDKKNTFNQNLCKEITLWRVSMNVSLSFSLFDRFHFLYIFVNLLYVFSHQISQKSTFSKIWDWQKKGKKIIFIIYITYKYLISVSPLSFLSLKMVLLAAGREPKYVLPPPPYIPWVDSYFQTVVLGNLPPPPPTLGEGVKKGFF